MKRLVDLPPPLGRLLALGLVLLGLVSAEPAQASCRKEILVYLDVSGSMKPTVRNADDSPFRRTVEALSALVQEPDFVQEGDVLKLRLFGETIQARRQASGRADISALIADLRSNAEKSNLSNLVTVVQDVGKELANDGGGFDRRLVIIASDFVHEHALNRSASVYISHWQEGIADTGLILSDIFNEAPDATGRGSNRAFLFLTLPAYTSDLTSVRQRVLDQLTAELPQAQSDLAMSPRDIANEILSRLLLEPRLTGHITNGDGASLEVEVRNPNCQAVTVAEVKAGCDRTGDPRPLALGGSQTLEAGASARTVAMKLDDLNCSIGDVISFEARLQEGPVGQGDTSVGNRIEIRPLVDAAGLSATLVKRPGKDKLFIYLQIRGQILSPGPIEFTILRGGTSYAEGAFELPAGQKLSSEEWQKYLLPIDSRALPGGFFEVELQVPEAELTESTIRVQENVVESRANWLFIVLAVLLFVISGYNAVFSRKQRRAFSSAANQILAFTPGLIGSLALSTWELFSASPVLQSTAYWAKWFLLAFFAAPVLFLIFRLRRREMIEKDISLLVGSEGNRDRGNGETGDRASVQSVVEQVESIIAQGQSGGQLAGRALVFSAIAVGTVLLIIFLVRPDALVAADALRGVLQVAPR